MICLNQIRINNYLMVFCAIWLIIIGRRERFDSYNWGVQF
jgi:hypothetical protein